MNREIISVEEKIVTFDFKEQSTTTAKIIRKLEDPIIGIDSIKVKVKSFAQTFQEVLDENNNPTGENFEVLEKIIGEDEYLTFSNAEVQGLFQALQNPIDLNENFLSEFNLLLLNALLYQTVTLNYFDTQNWIIKE